MSEGYLPLTKEQRDAYMRILHAPHSPAPGKHIVFVYEATVCAVEADRKALADELKTVCADYVKARAERDAWRTIAQWWVGGMDVPQILGFYSPGCELDEDIVAAIKVIVSEAEPNPDVLWLEWRAFLKDFGFPPSIGYLVRHQPPPHVRTSQDRLAYLQGIATGYNVVRGIGEKRQEMIAGRLLEAAP